MENWWKLNVPKYLIKIKKKTIYQIQNNNNKHNTQQFINNNNGDHLNEFNEESND